MRKSSLSRKNNTKRNTSTHMKGGKPSKRTKTTGKTKQAGQSSNGSLSDMLWATIENLRSLNSSKYFAGIMMLTLNLGSKYITLELSKTQEAYLKYTIGRQVLLFSILWMGTRDVVISLVLTALFVFLGNYLLNENSRYCILPKNFHLLRSHIDTNNDGVISEKEIDDAIQLLKTAKENKSKKQNVDHILEDKHNELFRENYI